MKRNTTFAPGEVYHIYNRGAHKKEVFTSQMDYERLLLLLYVANDSARFEMRTLFKKYGGRSSVTMFEEEKPTRELVDILAYCLMPNHIHLIVRQKAENGISSFFKKVLTGYSMYFNAKHEHSGVLFQGRFKSKHVDTEEYFRYLFAYVHLNPLDLYDSEWEKRANRDKDAMHAFLAGYPYSSYADYLGGVRPQRAILSLDDIPDFLRTQNDLDELLRWYTEDRPPEKEV